jgi:Meckel syndrome type 1 protein
MKQQRQNPRAAIVLLLAGIALPLNPAFAQVSTVTDPPVVNAPPPVTAPPTQPPVVSVTPPPAARPTSPFQAPPAPAPPRAAEPTDEATAEPATTAARSQPAARRARAPARQAPAESPPAARDAPAAAPVAEPAAPLAELPAAQPPAPAPLPRQLAPREEEVSGTGLALPWLIGAAVLAIVAFAAYALRRRRRRVGEEYDEEPYELTDAVAPSSGLSAPAAFAAAVPLAAAAPLTAASPATAYDANRVEHPADPGVATGDRISIGEPDSADVEALAAASEAPDGRPWLEFLLRPVRAGTTSDDTVVEFELTVGNTGSVPARDVRISTWMFAAGSAAESEMERMLIEPPAGAQSPKIVIPAGDGARVDAALALPRTGLDETVLPVVVADARYTLPDGSEGRTSASFEIGMKRNGTLAPFRTDRASGLLKSVEARLHGELERT